MNTTSLELKDYLHYYLGCDCETPDGIRTLDAVYRDSTPVFYDSVCEIDFIYIKPILRPLSSITEAEIFDILNLMVPDDFKELPEKDEVDFEMFYNDGAFMVDGDVAAGANYSCRCYEGQIAITYDGTIHMWDENSKQEKQFNVPKAYQYLLSKSFDLFGLVAAGLAVEQNNEGDAD